jgi:hypothetical protein
VRYLRAVLQEQQGSERGQQGARDGVGVWTVVTSKRPSWFPLGSRAHVHIAERRWYGGESTWVISGERKKHCTQVAFYDNILSALYDTTHLTRCGGHSNNKPLLHCLGNKAGPSSAKAGPLAPPMSMPGQKSWAGGELNVE